MILTRDGRCRDLQAREEASFILVRATARSSASYIAIRVHSRPR